MKKKRSFTIIEIIGSVLVITALAGGMFGAFIGSQYILNRTRHRMQAFNFARESYDNLRSEFSFNDPELDVGSDYPESNIGTVIKGELSDLEAVLTYDVGIPEGERYKTLTFNITWEERAF